MAEDTFHGMSLRDPRLAARLDEMSGLCERLRNMTVEGLLYENTPSGITIGLPPPHLEPAAPTLIPVQVAVAGTATVSWPYLTGTTTCSTTLCTLASVTPKANCVVTIPANYAVWDFCEGARTNANRIATAAAPLFRETGNAYTSAIGQWNAGSETLVTWNTQSSVCGTVAVPATIGTGLGYYDCSNVFVLAAVAQEDVLETLWGYNGTIDRVAGVRICTDGGTKRLVQENRRMHFVNGHMVLDEQLCSTIIGTIGVC
jgi:hypothetical protein